MGSRSVDDNDYRFLTSAGASVEASLAANEAERLELRLFGNRAGVLSLANVLLWLIACSWRREILSLSELPFIKLTPALSVCIRLSGNDPDGQHGRVDRLDRGQLLEWLIAEEDLRQAALWVHGLACDPSHEYVRLLVDGSSQYDIHIRLTDAAKWLEPEMH